jgi:hypothetical protein
MTSGPQNGKANNPYGRPRGSKNEIAADFRKSYQEAKARGYPHPYLRMMEIVCDPNEDKTRRDMFLKECASYTCNKPRYIRHVEGELPNFNTIEEAEIYLRNLAIESAQQLEPEELATIVRAWIESKRAGTELDIKLINSGAATGQQTLVIEGGLPSLPGANITMSELNGHAVNPPTRHLKPGAHEMHSSIPRAPLPSSILPTVADSVGVVPPGPSPRLSSLQLLQSVVNDPGAPLFLRMDAARFLLEHFPQCSAYAPSCVLSIPALP